jgi:hypothetical protein
MGLVETKRPVVLIAEGEFLLRMAAVDMIVAAGFAALDAGEADEAIEIPNALGTSHKDFPICNCTSEAWSFGPSGNNEG